MVEETLPSGTVLHGHYRIERVLGSGGFGHVYLAIDLNSNQQYALKEYLVKGSGGQEQLKHEAAVLSQLHHPNLPAFQDAFIEHNRYYVVINYIEGNDLTDLIRVARQRNETIPMLQIMGWILAICDAVLFLHSQRPPVIHRDIKPDNIRIMPNNTALLVDLGNAKAAADGARTLFFIRHQGTPGYAPPEQYPGGTGTDTRSDVYALGGTLYFALTAHEPPSVSIRNESIQRGRHDLPTLQEVLANNPPEENPEANAARQFRLGVTKPSKPAPRHLRHIAQLGTIPAPLLNELSRIIQRSMAMRPRDRYQHVADFAKDLRKVMAELPVPPPPPKRSVDLHSTQPDLPMLYEALQAAKDNNNTQDIPDSSTAPMSSPSPPTPPTENRCSDCNAPVLAKASYCPKCGAALHNAASSNITKANSGIRDISAEETVLVKQGAAFQQQLAAASYGLRASSVSQTNAGVNTPSALTPINGTPAPSRPFIQKSTTITTGSKQQQKQQGMINPLLPSVFGLKLTRQNIGIGVVILLVLITAIILFIVNN